MIIEGEVTEVNQELLTFTIDETARVYLVLLILKKPEQKLPVLGSKVKISSPIFHSDPYKVNTMIIYPEEECSLTGDFSVSFSSKAFAQVVKKHNLQPRDLIIVDCNYELIKKKFKQCHGQISFTNEELVISIIDSVTVKKELPDFRLKFVKEMHYVDLAPEDYKDFDDYWTFGLHRISKKKSEVKFLLGYLYAHRRYGTVHLRDERRYMQCVIVNNSQQNNLLIYLNKYVLIEDPRVLTEVYNSTTGINVEYLLIDTHKIKILKVYETNQALIEKGNFENPDYKSFEFLLLSKAVPMLTPTNAVVCWLELEDKITKRKVLLRLGQMYAPIFPILQENFIYKLHHVQQLNQIVNNRELKTARPNLNQYELPPRNCIFQPMESDLSSAKILNVDQAIHELGHMNVVCFKGFLKVKKFVNPLSSRTQNILPDIHFGTLGYKTHLLEFHGSDKKVLTLYLNNWENLSIPMGLIPEMFLLVSNVVGQKGNYYKSTALTNIRVIVYKPRLFFTTADLIGGINNTNWGLPYALGLGKGLPYFCIVWTQIAIFSIRTLKIFYQCKKCLVKLNFNEVCKRCLQKNQELTASILLYVRDSTGSAMVKAEGKTGMNLIKLFLGVQEKIFKIWCNGFQVLNNFEFLPHLKNGEQNEMVKNLNGFFKRLNKFGTPKKLEFKCKKIEEQGRPVYALLQVRTS